MDLRKYALGTIKFTQLLFQQKKMWVNLTIVIVIVILLTFHRP